MVRPICVYLANCCFIWPTIFVMRGARAPSCAPSAQVPKPVLRGLRRCGRPLRVDHGGGQAVSRRDTGGNGGILRIRDGSTATARSWRAGTDRTDNRPGRQAGQRLPGPRASEVAVDSPFARCHDASLGRRVRSFIWPNMYAHLANCVFTPIGRAGGFTPTPCTAQTTPRLATTHNSRRDGSSRLPT